MNTIQTVAKNTGSLALMNIMSLGLGMVLSVFLARNFGDVAFGKYSFAIALTSFLATFIDFGLNQLIIREVSREKILSEKYVNNAMFIKIILSVFSFALIILIINLSNYPDDTRMIIYILGIATIFTSFGQLFRAIFHAFEKMEYNSIITIIERMVVTIIGLCLMILGYSLVQMVLAYVIGGILDVIISLIITSKKFLKPHLEFDYTFCKRVMKSAIPFGINSIFIVIFVRISTIMLSSIAGDAAVGWYNAAVTLVLALSFIPSIILSAIFPLLSRSYITSAKSHNEIYIKIFRYLFIIAFPIGVGTTVLADKLILQIYGMQFTSSIIALQILIWWHVIGSVNWLLGTVLQSINKQKIFTISTALCAIINVICNLIIIPKMGYVGACISTIITEGILLILLMHFISEYLAKISTTHIIKMPIFAGLIMALSIFFIKEYLNIMIVILIAGIVYFVSLLILGGITREDKRLLRRIISGDA